DSRTPVPTVNSIAEFLLGPAFARRKRILPSPREQRRFFPAPGPAGPPRRFRLRESATRPLRSAAPGPPVRLADFAAEETGLQHRRAQGGRDEKRAGARPGTPPTRDPRRAARSS